MANLDTCYACDSPATTREHVPPQGLFPKAKDSLAGVDLRRNLITVPSCAAHNLEKSRDDVYFEWVICCNLPANSVAKRQIETKLSRAIRRDPSLLSMIDKDSKDVVVVDSHSGQEHEATEETLDGARFEKVIDLIARGLFRHHYGESWLGPVRVVPDFIDFPDEPDQATLRERRIALFNLAMRSFATCERHGANPDVFWFQARDGEGGCRCVMRLAFYGACTATAFFGELR